MTSTELPVPESVALLAIEPLPAAPARLPWSTPILKILDLNDTLKTVGNADGSTFLGIDIGS